jgi:integrase
MDKVQKPFDGEKPRDRVWSDDEIKALWKAADKLDELWPYYLKLVIVMGQRKSEISGMRRDGLDLEQGVWKLPEDERKSKRGHKFPLPALAVRILKGMPRVEGSPFVFPGRSDKAMHVGSKVQDRIKKLSGVEDFTFHDARRTFRTGLDKLKVPPHVKLECLGHARQGVGDIHYSHYDYLDEQREAFEAWAAHVEKLVYPDGVVGLHG